MIGVGLSLSEQAANARSVRVGAPLRAMAAGAAIPTGKATVDAGVTMVRTRTRHKIFADSAVIAAQWPLFQTTDSSGGIESNITWPAGTTFKASAELVPAAGRSAAPTLARLTFGGIDTWTAPTGGQAGGILATDELPAGAFGLAGFVPGDLVYLKTEIVFPTAGTGQHPLADGGGGGSANAGEGCYYGGTGSVNATGTLVSQGGSNQTGTRIGKPLVVLGRHAGVAVMGIGDSISFGKGANPINGDGATAGSWQTMAAYASGVPLTKVAVSGDRAAAFTAARRPRAIALAAYHTHAVIAHGTNDVGAGAVGSGMGALISAECDALRAINPALNILAAQVPIRTSSSTDSWATVAGQTIQSGWTAGSRRDLANASIAVLVGSKISAVLPSFDGAMADPVDPLRWKVTGAPNYATLDGTHPSQVMHGAMADAAHAAFAGMTA